MKKILISALACLSINSVCFAEFVHTCRLTSPNECDLTRAYTVCSAQVYGLLPQDLPNEQKICHDAYLVGANLQTKDPDWVAYYLTPDHVPAKSAAASNRVDYFCPDPCLKSGERSEESDYTGLFPTYNRGHMDPAEDNEWDMNIAYQQSFYYSNVVPQNPDNNDGIWGTLEDDVNTWAKLRGPLYIVDGPIYDYQGKTHQVVGGNKVWAPVALYKIIYDPKSQQTLAFIIPNQKLDPSTLNQYLTSVDNVNHLAGMPGQNGLDLFYSLPESIKSKTPNALWPLS